MAIITHPDLPFELEHVGQEVICRYPEGAEAIASRTEYLAALLLVRLDRLIEGRKSTPITEGPVLEQVLEVAEEAIAMSVLKQALGRKSTSITEGPVLEQVLEAEDSAEPTPEKKVK